jgi:hypothetical protein
MSSDIAPSSVTVYARFFLDSIFNLNVWCSWLRTDTSASGALVEPIGIEPMTSGLQSRRSPS